MSKPDINRQRQVRTTSNGVWPAIPAVYDDYESNLAWRVRHSPDTLSRADRYHICWIIRAYFQMVEQPARHRAAIVRELRAEQSAVREALGAWPDEETGEWMTPEDLR